MAIGDQINIRTSFGNVQMLMHVSVHLINLTVLSKQGCAQKAIKEICVTREKMVTLEMLRINVPNARTLRRLL